MKNRFRIAAGLLVAAVTLSSGPVWAGGGGGNPIAGENLQSCGKWVLRLEDFGKLKIRDYNSYVPENFQRTPGRLKPTVTFLFLADTFSMVFGYLDQQGMVVLRAVTGSYTQKGKRLKFTLDAAGVDALEDTFADLAENMLFGERALVTDIPFVNLDMKKFKGRIKKNNRFKVKFNTRRLEYDIQFVGGSEFPDKFSAKGVFKLRSRSKDCSD